MLSLLRKMKADVFAGLFFLLLAGFGVVLAAALSFGVAAVCLLTIRGFFRKNAKQYRRFSAAQAA